MARIDTLGHFLTDVANAIRNKSGKSATISAANFDTEINNLDTKQKYPDALSLYSGVTKVKTYTTDEALALTQWPTRVYVGGTNYYMDEVNWTIEGMKDYIRDNGKLEVAGYSKGYTNSGTQTIKITINWVYLNDNSAPSPNLHFCCKNCSEVRIFWGTGSSETAEVHDVTGVNTYQYYPHTYSSAPPYSIVIYVDPIDSSAEVIFDKILCGGASSTTSKDALYASVVRGFSCYDGDSYCTVRLANQVFKNCTRLTNVHLEKPCFPSAEVGYHTELFSGCTALEYFVCPKGMQFNGQNFYGCEQLEKVILSEGCHLGSYEFSNCKKLLNLCLTKGGETFDVDNTIPSFLCSGCNRLNWVIIPEGITTLGSSCFQFAYALSDVHLPSTVTTLGSSFYYCTGLKGIDLHEGITTIGNNAFIESGLKTIVLPSTITAINSGFYSCHELLYIDLSRANRMVTITSQGLGYVGSSVTWSGPAPVIKIIVPDNLYNTYIADTNWSYYKDYIISKTDWDAR